MFQLFLFHSLSTDIEINTNGSTIATITSSDHLHLTIPSKHVAFISLSEKIGKLEIDEKIISSENYKHFKINGSSASITVKQKTKVITWIIPEDICKGNNVYITQTVNCKAKMNIKTIV